MTDEEFVKYRHPQAEVRLEAEAPDENEPFAVWTGSDDFAMRLGRGATSAEAWGAAAAALRLDSTHGGFLFPDETWAPGRRRRRHHGPRGRLGAVVEGPKYKYSNLRLKNERF